jgi:hypothetical protein
MNRLQVILHTTVYSMAIVVMLLDLFVWRP